RSMIAVMAIALLGSCASSPSNRADTGPRVRGALCEDPRLQGRSIEPLTGQWSACTVRGAVMVTSASGVRINPPAKLNCAMARRVAGWLGNGVQVAAQRGRGQRIVAVRSLGSYSCRRRNGLATGRLSEHARANALDIAAFTFSDGLTVSVESGWRRPNEGRFLREVWRSACGPFGTVLGPDSDRFHYNHLHVDAARYPRPYCK
ncbi:MAG: extensin family protein, partial [Pseudomonadota bacterium]